MLTKDQEWIHEHFAELVEKYGGKYVSVAMEELVAVGDSAKEVDNTARKKYPRTIPSVLRVPKEEDFECIL
ncbi:MAG: DUF5678 domain-containing protein [bacterium]|nr:DUF5678 domain-containing protein [bacterium]